MKEINDGGPAFGEFEMVGDVAVRNGGISIRQYYMAHIEVPGDLPMSWGEYWVGPWPVEDYQAQRRWWVQVYAKYKAVHADAMIAEGSK